MMIERTEFEVAEMFEAAVAAGLEIGWSDDRLREEFEAALASAIEPEDG